MSKICIILTSYVMLLLVSACGSNNKVEYDWPKSREEKRREEIGSIISKEQGGGIYLFGGKKKDNTSASMSANEYLWRASLEVISFMPLQQSDAVGGVIITEWYSDAKAPSERFKLNVHVNSGELTANAVQVSVFKQVMDKHNNWQTAPVNDKLARELEDKIINRARQLKSGNPV